MDSPLPKNLRLDGCKRWTSTQFGVLAYYGALKIRSFEQICIILLSNYGNPIFGQLVQVFHPGAQKIVQGSLGIGRWEDGVEQATARRWPWIHKGCRIKSSTSNILLHHTTTNMFKIMPTFLINICGWRPTHVGLVGEQGNDGLGRHYQHWLFLSTSTFIAMKGYGYAFTPLGFRKAKIWLWSMELVPKVTQHTTKFVGMIQALAPQEEVTSKVEDAFYPIWETKNWVIYGNLLGSPSWKPHRSSNRGNFNRDHLVEFLHSFVQVSADMNPASFSHISPSWTRGGLLNLRGWRIEI